MFTTENGVSLRNTYGAWKKLNVTVQAQFGNSADEAAAAELKEVEVFFNIDDSGNLCLYSARESKGVQLVIPAGTIITPAADAGSTVKLRITNEIILVRKAVNYGTTSGWALKGETSEEEPPTEEPPVEETYTDVELTFKNASSGYMFTTENSANLLATYGAWKKLNVTVQEQYGNSGAEAEAAELKELEVFFNLDDSGNLCLFGAHEFKAVKLVIPAGTIITPADNSTKLRITNEIVLVRDASNYGTTNGWAVKSETTEEEPPAEETYTDIVLTFKNASSGYTFTAEDSANLLATYGAWKKLNVTVQEQYGNSADEAAAAELKEKAVFFNLDDSGNFCLFGANEYKAVKLVIPAGTIITPADNSTKLRITNEIVLVRDPANHGSVNGWAVKSETSEEEPPAEETYTDIVLTFKNASSGYTFTAEDSANLLATYGAWKKLNVTVQEQYGNSADEAAAAELKEKAVFFNLDDSGNFCLFGANEYKAVKLVIPAGTIITPADNSTKLRITNEIVLVRDSTNYGTVNGWQMQ